MLIVPKRPYVNPSAAAGATATAGAAAGAAVGATAAAAHPAIAANAAAILNIYFLSTLPTPPEMRAVTSSNAPAMASPSGAARYLGRQTGRNFSLYFRRPSK